MFLANDWKKTARGQALEVLEEVFQEGAYSNIALNARPVSYTHLDVYKRQPYGCS